MKIFYLKICGLSSFFLFLSTFFAMAQTGSIIGKVLDEHDLPLPGATIIVEGSGKATQTDADGNYKINSVVFGNVSVTARFVGYNSMTKKGMVSNQPLKLDFELLPNNKSLEEVVVIGYGSVNRKDLTGSVSTVSSKDFQKGTITTPDQLIQGKVAGVSITSNGGNPGASATIRIRGGASLNASNDPLIVVDGNPLSGDEIKGVSNVLSLINPNDIETFTILKDANATAIYGSRASNGVILITTKKGSNGKPQVNFSTNNSIATIAKKVDILSSDQIREYVHTNGTINQIELLGNHNTDWQDIIFREAFTTDNNLSISGSIKTIPYRISTGYINQNGVLLTDNMQRGVAGLNLSPKLFDQHLKIDLNVKGSLSKSHFGDHGAMGAAISFDPTQPVLSIGNGFGDYFEWLSGNVPNPNTPRNPLGLLEQRENIGKTQRSFGNLQLDYSLHFLPELHVNFNFGYDVAKGKGYTKISEHAASNYSTRGFYQDYGNKLDNYFVEGYLNYTKDIKEINSNINAVVGYGYYDNKSTFYNYKSFNALGGILSTPNFDFDVPQNRLLSYYGRLIYTLSNKYIVSGTLRADGSSKFSEDSRWGYFPSAAFTWRINQEGFLQGQSSISDLKLRLSYGETGNKDGIANYSYIPNYYLTTGESQYQIGDTFYQTYTPISYDAELKWETTQTYNAGIDYGFLDNRITGSIDAYIKKTKDLLAVVEIPVGTNFNNQILTNVGNMENKGIEVNLNFEAIKKNNLTWNVGVNGAYNDNKVTNLSLVGDNTVPQSARNATGGTGNSIQYHSVGYSPFAFYVYKQVYDTNGKPLEGLYEDLNGDGIINTNDMYLYKSPVPKCILGFNTSLTVNKLTFTTVLRANIGNYIYDNIGSNLGTKRNIISPSGNINNAGTDVYNTNFTVNQYNSDYYVKNASFLKMDNLGVSYAFGSLIKGINSNLSVAANCQNVFVISKYKGVDPENFTGIDYTLYPRPRTFTLGVNFQF
ncbi:SusC/RagA family TonB-linked outer membrane protein [Pseudopedobacter beijingensis]|uniref:SusC/RagA family TonB-linked outer membrane protein n=1 Tax=Pseudopedobacter beijingensis TaxID=1207056 RepID=A0ABW4I8U3_9SPHI